MDNQAIEASLTAIQSEIDKIRSAIGSGEGPEQGNPMITPEKPSMMSGLQLGK
jgi:hypothetical protein